MGNRRERAKSFLEGLHKFAPQLLHYFENLHYFPARSVCSWSSTGTRNVNVSVNALMVSEYASSLGFVILEQLFHDGWNPYWSVDQFGFLIFTPYNNRGWFCI